VRISYDPEVDALSIMLYDTTVTTQELADGVAGEYDAQGRLVGIEILDAAKRFGDASPFRQVTLEGFGPPALQSSGLSSP
jgi:YD repeat-containing protein